ncbi:response regulator transcription factor, partial [Acinetobacter baumannii]
EGLKKILLESLPFATIHDVGDSADLFKRAIKESWDIIISDISMPGYSGIEILKQIKTHAPNTPVLMLSMYPPEQYAVRAIKAG